MNQTKNEVQNKAPVQAVSDQLHSNASCGLSRKEARSRYRTFGRNTLFDRDHAGKSAFWVAFFRDPSIVLFLFIVILSLFFAPVSNGIAAILAFLCVVGYPLRVRLTRKKNESVTDRISMPRTKLIREGRVLCVRADHVVPGDLIILRAGDVVPADCRLVTADGLRVLTIRRDDEGRLVRRIVTKRALPQELVSRSVDFESAEDLLYGVSEILEGEALAVVLATGEDTYWRGAQWGVPPTELHRAEWDAGDVARAVDPFLNIYTLILFVSFFVLALISVLFYAPDEVDLIAVLLSLGAMLCIDARSILLTCLDSFETGWRESRLRSHANSSRVILKSNQLVDAFCEWNELFVMGKEAASLLREDASGKHCFAELLELCRKQGIRLSVFFESGLPTSVSEQLRELSLALDLSAPKVDEKHNLIDYIGKYRVFCGVTHENIRKLATSLRKQGRRIAVLSDRSEDLDILSVGTIAVGIAELSDLFAGGERRKTALMREADAVQPSSALLRHADVLTSPTTGEDGVVLRLLSVRNDAGIVAAQGAAAFRFLIFSRIFSFFLISFSCIFGVGLPNFFCLLFGMGGLTTVGFLWLSSLRPTDAQCKMAVMKQKRLLELLSDRATWVPAAGTGFFCAGLMMGLSLLGVVSLREAQAFLLCSLLLVQLCALFLGAAEAQLALSFNRMLLPLLAVALPMLVLSGFCVAFDGIDAIVGLGNWSVATLCALPFVPTLYFCLRYLFLRFFDRTAK